MTDFHSATFQLLGMKPHESQASRSEVEHAERRLGIELPASVQEWYCNEEAIEILAKYSNDDWPVAIRDFAVKEWKTNRLLPFKNENQGVCTWAVLLDGSDDPPVYIDVDSEGTQWTMQAPTFSAHVYWCVWDYSLVLDAPALVQAINDPLSKETLGELRRAFSEQPSTFGWPGHTQVRFTGKDPAILIWADEREAEWFIGTRDAQALKIALGTVWDLDNVGPEFKGSTEIGEAVLDEIRRGV